MNPDAPATVAPETTAPEAERLKDVIARVERGETVRLDSLLPLVNGQDRNVRGLAKRLLAKLVTEQARHESARLLFSACDELECRQPELVAETAQQLFDLRQAGPLLDLLMKAAEYAAGRGDFDTTLVQMQNALALDPRAGGTAATHPDTIRRAVRLYERVARGSPWARRVQPATPRQRRSPAGEKLRLAHCVCQIAGPGHAPTDMVISMLRFADHERFDNSLIVTESLVQHARQPHQICTTPDSAQRAPDPLRHIRQHLGIPVFMPGSFESFQKSAADLHRQLAEKQIDIVFFHGSLTTPIDWLLCAWQAAPWQFDRGFGVPLYCPNVNYQFFEMAPLMDALSGLFRERGVPFGLGPLGAIDLSHFENAQPLPRAELGIPDDHVILGTVGNHLPARMGADFCRTVADVMKRHPKTTYLVIGPGPFEYQPTLFETAQLPETGGGPRVRFLGSKSNPARWTRTFDIYLNEYPGGGGMSIREAMACGKPIVCMQAGESLYSLAAAVCVGEDNLVTPASNEAYAQRLDQLIAEPDQRQLVAETIHNRYKQEFNPTKFARGMTDKIWEIVSADING
jgi:glycosyltransferase involved in cell wall biosynthesis